MNTDFVIESKYDNGIGFIEVDDTRKLVRHFEYICGLSQHITLDVYEDGLIKCHEKILKSTDGHFNKNNPENIITSIFTIELTNREKINDAILELIDNIYFSLCVKMGFEELIEVCQGNTHIIYCDIPLLSHGITYDMYGIRLMLIKETFNTLRTLKKLYEKIVIF